MKIKLKTLLLMCMYKKVKITQLLMCIWKVVSVLVYCCSSVFYSLLIGDVPGTASMSGHEKRFVGKHNMLLLCDNTYTV